METEIKQGKNYAHNQAQRKKQRRQKYAKLIQDRFNEGLRAAPKTRRHKNLVEAAEQHLKIITKRMRRKSIKEG